MPEYPIEALDAVSYRIPTPEPEADGTLAWDATTVVVVHARTGGVTGLGWTYADRACVPLIEGPISDAVVGREALDVPASWHAMQRQIRNLGRPGLVSCAMSAVDIALWDAAARLLQLPLSRLLGRVRASVALYGSGGFVTADDAQLAGELGEWVSKLEIPRVKIKIGESWGTEVERDLARVALARRVVGPDVELYVDANGAYAVGQAIRVGAELAEYGVTWFEEPVSSDDLTGLRRVRDGVAQDVTAGEYGYDLHYFTRMIGAESIDCVQVDVTRCGGYTEWGRIAALAAAHDLDVSAHCAPNLSAHVGVATPNFRHIEWFADHDRIESMLFDGGLDPALGEATPELSAAGHGLSLKPDAGDRFAGG